MSNALSHRRRLITRPIVCKSKRRRWRWTVTITIPIGSGIPPSYVITRTLILDGPPGTHNWNGELHDAEIDLNFGVWDNGPPSYFHLGATIYVIGIDGTTFDTDFDTIPTNPNNPATWTFVWPAVGGGTVEITLSAVQVYDWPFH